MTIEDTIRKIIQLPVDFQILNKSAYSLLQESGYFDVHDQINDSELLEAQMKCPEYADKWIAFSEDKRTSEGWFVTTEGNKVVVGYVKERRISIREEFSDKFEAVAIYIKREIEDMRSL